MSKILTVKYTVEEFNLLAGMAYISNMIINTYRQDNPLKGHQALYEKIAKIYLLLQRKLNSKILEEIENQGVDDYLLDSQYNFIEEYCNAFFNELFARKMVASNYPDYNTKDLDHAIIFDFAEKSYLEELNKNGMKNVSIRIKDFSKKQEEYLKVERVARTKPMRINWENFF